MDNHKGMTFQSAYTWSHCLDYGSGDFATITNPYDLKLDRGNCDLDRRHVLNLNYVWDLPFFKGSQSKAMRSVLGGWQISGITSFQSGLPKTAIVSGDNAGVGGANVRPILLSNPNEGPKTVGEWFNTGAFATPEPLTFGTAGRGIIRAPGRNNWNLSMFKVFSGIPLPKSPEGGQIQFRAEFFNAFNHTQFHDINTTLGGGFGEVTSTADPRVIQFGMKFLF
jgi:hypothetical protein